MNPASASIARKRRSPDRLRQTVSRPVSVWARHVHPEKRRAVPTLKLYRHRRAVSAPKLRPSRAIPTIQGTYSAMYAAVRNARSTGSAGPQTASPVPLALSFHRFNHQNHCQNLFAGSKIPPRCLESCSLNVVLCERPRAGISNGYLYLLVIKSLEWRPL